MVYRSHMLRRSELDQERMDFVERLVGVIMTDEPYMYMDESSLHGFMYGIISDTFRSASRCAPKMVKNKSKLFGNFGCCVGT